VGGECRITSLGQMIRIPDGVGVLPSGYNFEMGRQRLQDIQMIH
jgi:hypothetical protein